MSELQGSGIIVFGLWYIGIAFAYFIIPWLEVGSHKCTCGKPNCCVPSEPSSEADPIESDANESDATESNPKETDPVENQVKDDNKPSMGLTDAFKQAAEEVGKGINDAANTLEAEHDNANVDEAEPDFNEGYGDDGNE